MCNDSWRRLLLATTALLAPGDAIAQAPDARPMGGNVVAGQASISQTPARTQVTQTTDRAVIEWQRFDVGVSHHVDIRQPAATSWSLQRVTGGDPSAIAGRVTSNGGVALVNPAGLVFSQGAQVDVASLIATSSDITNNNFMAGRMAFDGAPRPGARVENRGRVTVAERGLAALVGPAVANSGTINARLGRVALAEAEAFTLDLAGDGLLSLDVTRQVTAAPSGAAVLVTNTGTIEAAGGSVLLTAEAASGVLETLVSAGGRIAAAGGSIEVNAPGGGVTVPSGAVLDASAPAGGGRVTVGAAATSRLGAPERLSARSRVEAGATLRADATRAGAGGTVIVHAAERTEMRGRISAQGGPQGGAGGAIEVSSRRALALDGVMQAGPGGQVLVDPTELRIVERLSGGTEPAEITAAAINATTGALTLQAERQIRVQAAVDKQPGPLTLQTTARAASPGDGIHIARGLRVVGDLTLLSAGDITQTGSGAAIDVSTLYAASSAGAVRLEAGDNAIRALAGGGAATRFAIATSTALSVDGAIAAQTMRLAANEALVLHAPLAASGMMELVAQRGIAQQAFGVGLQANTLRLEAPLGAITLAGAGNRITHLGDVAAPIGFALANETALNISGTLSSRDAAISIAAGDLTQGPASRILVSGLEVAVPQGAVRLDGRMNAIQRLRGMARDGLTLDAGGALMLDGRLTAAHVDLRATGDITQQTDALVTTGLLRVHADGGSLRLEDPLNAIAALGPSAASHDFSLASFGALAIQGSVTAPRIGLTTGGSLTQGAGGSLVTDLLHANALIGDVTLAGSGNAVRALGASGAAGGFALSTSGTLAVTGAVDAGGRLALQAGALDLAASLAAPAVSLRATSGDVVQQAGQIAAGQLRAEAAGRVRLEAGGNAIAAIAGQAGIDFRVATEGSALAEDIAAPEVALAVGGHLSQATNAEGIRTELLDVSAGGRVDLGAAGNAIHALGAMRAPAGLSLSTTTGLLLTMPLELPQASLTAGGDILQMPGAPLSTGSLRLAAGGSITLEATNFLPRLLSASAGGDLRLASSGEMELLGAVTAGGTLALQAIGDLRQGGGMLSAAALEARSVQGSVLLQGAGNRFGRLVRGGAAGRFALTHDGAETLQLTGLLAAPEIFLTLGAGLADAGGALRTEALGLASAGMVRLDGSAHRVGAISGRATALALSAGGALQVTGALDITGALALTADSLAFMAPVSAGGGAVLRATMGDIGQLPTGAGLAVTGGLEAHAAGAVSLAGAGNAVPLLLGGSAIDGFALVADGALTLRGALAGETLLLRAGGTLTLDRAMMTAGRAVLLAAPAGIAAGATSRLAPIEPARRPALVLDTRRTGGLTTIPDWLQADLPGLPAAAQPTQLSDFGPVGIGAAGGAAFDIAAGLSPVFLLLDTGPAVGVVEAGRLGVLGQGASAFLLGTIGGVGGAGAAGLITVAAVQGGYQFNGCLMGVSGCGGGGSGTPGGGNGGGTPTDPGHTPVGGGASGDSPTAPGGIPGGGTGGSPPGEGGPDGVPVGGAPVDGGSGAGSPRLARPALLPGGATMPLVLLEGSSGGADMAGSWPSILIVEEE